MVGQKRWVIGNPGAASTSTQINLATPQSPIHGPLEGSPHNPVEEPGFHQQQQRTPVQPERGGINMCCQALHNTQ